MTLLLKHALRWTINCIYKKNLSLKICQILIQRHQSQMRLNGPLS